HTRFSRDWSSDVCSSDLYPLFYFSVRVADNHGCLAAQTVYAALTKRAKAIGKTAVCNCCGHTNHNNSVMKANTAVTSMYFCNQRSEERRVGKEWGNWWSP